MGKQQLIMDKALELFAEQGINDTTVQQITDRCNMSKGAFYLAFKSKDTLITALIDRFMMEYTSDVDHLVISGERDELLERFFTYSYHFSLKHQTFSSLYIKEQLHKLNENLIEKMKYYNHILNESLYRLVDRLYEHKLPNEKYELVWIIKSFMQIYQKYSFEVEEQIDMNLFVASCVEKINLIATYSEKSFVTEETMIHMKWNASTIDETVMLAKMEEVLEDTEEPMIIESLQLLQEHVRKSHLPNAVVQGLLLNIQPYAVCKPITYMYRIYLRNINQ